jgi:hypothetical protein
MDERLHAWFGHLERVNRLAFGAKLLWLTEGKPSLPELVARTLGDTGMRLPPTGTDFSLKLNTRRPSRTVGGVELNQVRQWSQVQVVAESVMGGTPMTWDKHGVDLDLDINSVPAGIEAGNLFVLYRELKDLGESFAADGETFA